MYKDKLLVWKGKIRCWWKQNRVSWVKTDAGEAFKVQSAESIGKTDNVQYLSEKLGKK